MALPQKALPLSGVLNQAGRGYLEGHFAAEQRVMGSIDGAEAAAAEHRPHLEAADAGWHSSRVRSVCRHNVISGIA